MQVKFEQGIKQITPSGGWVALTWLDARQGDGFLPKYIPAIHAVIVWALLEDDQICGLIADGSGLSNPENRSDFLMYVANEEDAKSRPIVRETKQRRKERGLPH